MTQLSPEGTGGPLLGSNDNGNLIACKGWSFSYDAQNRLTSASNGAHTALFHYDGKNRQIMRSIDGVVRFSVWDDWELLEEYDTSNARTAAYLQGAHGVIKSLTNNIYYYQDNLGSTTHIANASGALLESYRYDLYGTPSYYDQNGQLKANQVSGYGIADLYAGERWNPELRLYDLRNRFMSPELGRFLQADPIGFKGDASNLYRYCHNDPVDFTDPTGLVASDTSRFLADRMWEMACFFDSGNSFQGSLSEFMQRLSPAGMDGGQGARDGATVDGQYSRPGPQEPVGRGSRTPSQSDEPLRMLPPDEATTEGYGRYAYYQLANHDNKPLSGGNLRFQEVTTKDPKNTFDIETSDKKPPHELMRGGLFKDHIGFKFRPEGRPPGSASLTQGFKSYYPDGRPGPKISTKFKHVTTLNTDRTITNSVYVIDP